MDWADVVKVAMRDNASATGLSGHERDECRL